MWINGLFLLCMEKYQNRVIRTDKQSLDESTKIKQVRPGF